MLTLVVNRLAQAMPGGFAGFHITDIAQMHLSANHTIAIPRDTSAAVFAIELVQPSGPVPVPRLAYTYQEAAEALGVSESTIKRQVKCGNLETLDLGRSRRVIVASIDRLIQSARNAKENSFDGADSPTC